MTKTANEDVLVRFSCDPHSAQHYLRNSEQDGDLDHAGLYMDHDGLCLDNADSASIMSAVVYISVLSRLVKV